MAEQLAAEELRKLTAKELTDRLSDAKAELFNLRFQLATNQLDNTARLGQVKRDVARIMTVMRQQEIEAWEAAQAVPSAAGGTADGKDETADGGRQTAEEDPAGGPKGEEPAVEQKRRFRRGR